MDGTLRLEMVLPQAASEFVKLPTAVRTLLRLCDGVRTLDAICGDREVTGALPPPQARQAVSRLVQLGLIAARATESKRKKALAERTLQWLRNEDGFSHDEEAFFASSVEHLIEA